MSIEQYYGSTLIAQSSLSASADDWRSKVLYNLRKILESGSDFPCPFARNAFKKDLLRFIFVDQHDGQGYEQCPYF